MNHLNTAPACTCSHHKIIPVLIVLFGLLFLLENMNVITIAFTSVAWPILVIIAGLVKFKNGSCKCYMHAA